MCVAKDRKEREERGEKFERRDDRGGFNKRGGFNDRKGAYNDRKGAGDRKGYNDRGGFKGRRDNDRRDGGGYNRDRQTVTTASPPIVAAMTVATMIAAKDIMIAEATTNVAAITIVEATTAATKVVLPFAPRRLNRPTDVLSFSFTLEHAVRMKKIILLLLSFLTLTGMAQTTQKSLRQPTLDDLMWGVPTIGTSNPKVSSPLGGAKPFCAPTSSKFHN